jgi:hypothetical protein
MKNLMMIGLITIIISCTKEKEVRYASNVDIGLEISVVDKSGNDLLDPANPNSFKEKDIRIYYLINGVKEEVFFPNYDHPRNFYIDKRDKVYNMILFLNDPITYIQWNNLDTDTIQCVINKEGGGELTICRKVWFNGELRWDNYSTERYIKIVK